MPLYWSPSLKNLFWNPVKIAADIRFRMCPLGKNPFQYSLLTISRLARSTVRSPFWPLLRHASMPSDGTERNSRSSSASGRSIIARDFTPAKLTALAGAG